MKKELANYLLIVFGSLLYAFSTVLFIFPQSLILGGTSGISVILNKYIPFSPGTISVIMNSTLLITAFFVLGKEMAIKSTVGSILTTVFIGLFEKVFAGCPILIDNIFVSAIIGAALIAVASGVMFYVKSSSGGTDIIALIVKKYSKINIGKALLITDFLIVVIGGALSGYIVMISYLVGLLVKTLGIDYIILMLRRKAVRNL